MTGGGPSEKRMDTVLFTHRRRGEGLKNLYGVDTLLIVEFF